LHQAGDLELTDRDIEDSRWKTGQSPPPVIQTTAQRTNSSIPQAEIESNAPYQPFHTDRRVGLYVYSYDEVPLPSPSVSALLSVPPLLSETKLRPTNLKTPWAFGGVIKSTRLDVGALHNEDEDFDLSNDHRALPASAIERVLRVTDSTEDMEQIVITTRRRKGIPRSGTGNVADGDEEGFFEDDCEVLDFASQRV
jgi:hypothetical protein